MGLNMENLIIKAHKGDKEAFTQAILLIKNDLYKIAKMKTTNEEDIQDIIQETMIYAYKYLKKLREPKKFKAWIIKILINNCNKYYRKKYKDNEIYDNYNIEFYKENIKYSSDQQIVDNTLDFYEMIKNLKYEERIIVVLYYGEKYTTKEISKILGVNENTVKTRLLRSKEKIKNTYKGGKYNG